MLSSRIVYQYIIVSSCIMLYRIIMSITETASCIINFRPFLDVPSFDIIWHQRRVESMPDAMVTGARLQLWLKTRLSVNNPLRVLRLKVSKQLQFKSIELNDILLWSVGPMTDRKWTYRVQLAEKTWFGDVRDSGNMPEGTFFSFFPTDHPSV